MFKLVKLVLFVDVRFSCKVYLQFGLYWILKFFFFGMFVGVEFVDQCFFCMRMKCIFIGKCVFERSLVIYDLDIYFFVRLFNNVIISGFEVKIVLF